MSTLPQLEEKIYSLVPELKELTFGCIVTTKMWNMTGKYCGKGIIDGKEWNFIQTDHEWITTTSEELEIIGHEILPSHWLPLLAGLFPNLHLLLLEDGLHIAAMGSDWVVYDPKKSFSEQSEPFRTWLLSQLP